MSVERSPAKTAEPGEPSPTAPKASAPCDHVEPQWRIVGCFLLLLIGLYVTAGPIVRLSEWYVEGRTDTELAGADPDEIRGGRKNPALMEAIAWHDGRWDLPERLWDTALVDGLAYNIYPPLFTFLSYVATPLGVWQDVPRGVFYQPWYILLVAGPLPLVGFWAFRQVLGDSRWAAVLTGYWLIGTPMLPVLANCREGSINAINQMLAATGMMLIAGDLLGRRRIWPAAIGLVIAAWSRQLTIVYGLAALWVVWQAGGGRSRRLVWVFAGPAVAAGVLMFLNWQKFGDPRDTGYAHIYEGGRETQWYGERAGRHGLFSRHFIAENAYYMNLAPPRFRTSKNLVIVQDNERHGVSIWMTSPLLLGGFLAIRRWGRKPAAQGLMAASLGVIGAFLMYHNPGSPQVGHFRFALDFVPIWLVVLAPWAVTDWRRWATLGCLAWSALYFHILLAR